MYIKIDNLKKKYRNKTALDDISIELTPGIYGLVGPNGAGKSTLFNILSGMITYDEGSIECSDYDFLSNEYYHNFGYLPQYNSLYNNLTVREFLEYMCILKEIEEKNIIDDILGIVNLTTKANEKIKNLSGGMKQRISIGQVLLNNPEIILLDEPTAGLDPRERIRLKNILGQLSKNKIIIVSTHIITDMENLADRIILLKKGNIISNKAPNVLIEEVSKYFYETDIGENELSKFGNRITSIQNKKGGYKIKYISDNNEPIKHCSVISLEDVYLYYYGDNDD